MTFVEQHHGPSTSRSLEESGIGTVMAITASHGVRFNVRIIRKGDKYGRDDCLIVGEEPWGAVNTRPDRALVEFYDSRFIDKFGALGQFVSRYYVETILGTDGYGSGAGGLNLDGGNPGWEIDARAMALVRLWLRHEEGIA